MRRLAPIALVAALCLPAFAVAEQAARPVPEKRVKPIPNTTLSKSSDGMVCKVLLRTGSRLGERKVCKTKAEWDAISQDARQATERRQIFMTTEPSGGF